jgi:glutathione S-transferase
VRPLADFAVLSLKALSPQSNPALRFALLVAGVLIPKVVFMAFYTVTQRIKHNAFVNPEDRNDGDPKVKPVASHDAVERIRRAHLNDLENIPLTLTAFLAAAVFVPGDHSAGLVYPALFAAVRLVHSASYLAGVDHFFRASYFSIGTFCTLGAADLLVRAALE